MRRNSQLYLSGQQKNPSVEGEAQATAILTAPLCERQARGNTAKTRRIHALPELVLLDRDGVINENRPDSVKNISELKIIRGAAEAIARLNHAGIGVAIVTNQSIVGRGIISAAALNHIHDTLLKILWDEAGARIDHIYVAPDDPNTPTMRRKPRPGMLLEALADFKKSAKKTIMIGDNMTDFEAAYAAGCQFHLVRTGNGVIHQEKIRQELATLLPPGQENSNPDHYIHDDLAAAIDSIFGTYGKV